MTNETDVTEVVAAPATAPLPRARADWWGHAALSAANALGTAISGLARLGGAAAAWAWRLAQTVPPGVRGFGLAAVGMLLGVVGAVALHNIAGVVCTVVVIPVCASVLGALAYRWYGGAGTAVLPRADSASAGPSTSELQRSVEYVDHKLALALTSLGTERHQQAVVALFQAKTAVELTLGTEQDSPSYDVALRADDYGLQPRVKAGPKPGSAAREGNSLAAS